MDYIKSPLNYTGNKYRILPQIIKKFPPKINVMVDLFCGGATVGINVECDEVFFIDANERIINLLEFLSKQTFSDLLDKFENIICQFNLSYSYKNTYSYYRKKCNSVSDNNGLKDYNHDGYYKMRSFYNKLINKETEEANILLYLLMVYGFNNDIRFNSKGEFNLPVGKTDLNKMNVEKIKCFIERCKSIKAHFICADFSDENINDIINQSDFIYMDPPYLITDAVYNEGWNVETEEKLLGFIDSLLEKGKNIALSNVISKVDMENKPLAKWTEKNKQRVEMHEIEYNYKSSSYHKINREAKEREILITNRCINEKN